MTVRDSGGNVAVDFVWGNLPLQPNDDRGEATLNAALDNHSIATTGYSNFPGYIPNYAGDGDTGLEVVVPNLVLLTSAEAATAITAAGLTLGTQTYSYPSVYSVVSSGKKVTVTHDGDFTARRGDDLFVNYSDGDAVTGNLRLIVTSASAGTFVGNTDTAISPALNIPSAVTSTFGEWQYQVVNGQSLNAGSIVDAGSAIDLYGIDSD